MIAATTNEQELQKEQEQQHESYSAMAGQTHAHAQEEEENEENNNNNNNATATAAATATKKALPDSDNSATIRRRLLQKLGIPAAAAATSTTATPTSSTRRVGSFREALKGDYGQTPKLHHHFKRKSNQDEPSSSYSSSQQQQRRRTVSFENTVRVRPIAHYSQYSQRIKPSLWASTSEIQENAARNAFEFQAEGWHWEGVIEEDDMYLYEGELIHPAHFVVEDEDETQ
mmetsp:Transcript_8279/g.17711  ORF Transcript_8279/g.17711 Transcript_8279/m.17711 type:complete len:229 (+) Transcript_8279:246-932(+)